MGGSVYKESTTIGCDNGRRNKMQDRYLKYRHYYADIDVCGFGGYGKAVYASLLPVFDHWFKRKSLIDIPSNIALLEDRSYLVDHPDYREERGGALSFHIKVLALSMVGLILKNNRKMISRQLLQCIIFDVSVRTKSYDYSDRLCFSITVRMFIDMLKEEFPHFGSQVMSLSFSDFANEQTLNPKPQEAINVL